MTGGHSGLIKSFGVFMLLVAIGVGITINVSQKTTPPAKATNSPVDIVPSVPPAPSQPATSVKDVHSSNADKKLILSTTTNQNGTTLYEFIISDNAGGSRKPLFARTLASGSRMALPINAWDPTDTYVFIEEKDQGVLNYFVFRTDGEPFANGDKFINVGSVWTAKKIGYTIREATGWASGTLLIIYTSKDDGSKGPAFWFEIPSTAIIQLAG